MFATASQVVPLGDGRFRAHLDASWCQGRGVYGGMVAALFVRALEGAVAQPDRRLRTLTVQFVAPAVPGPAMLDVEIVRAGKYATFASARLTCADGVAATALGTFACDRSEGPDTCYDDRPDLPPFDGLPAQPKLAGMPTFTGHVDYRWLLGAIYGGAADGVVGGWARLEGDVHPDAAMFAALLDVWAPAALTMVDRPRPAATMDLTYHFHLPLPLAGAGPRDAYAMRSVCTWAKAGYAEQAGSLWTADGRLVARQRQFVVLP